MASRAWEVETASTKGQAVSKATAALYASMRRDGVKQDGAIKVKTWQSGDLWYASAECKVRPV